MKILVVYGTRPEAIKMAPIVNGLAECGDKAEIKVCVTGQHREMLAQINSFFGIRPDYDLALMKPGQSLSDITIGCLSGMSAVYKSFAPDVVVVQGDTTTAMAAAMAAFYEKIPVAHLEAGLRSGDIYSPFPEEVNRKIISQIAEYHFAPTEVAARNLTQSGVNKGIHVVGNTVIDALLHGLEIVHGGPGKEYERKYKEYCDGKRLILVTGHRRESFGAGFESICEALANIVDLRKDVRIVYPVHLNPNVREPVQRILSGREDICLLEPLDYPELLWLMERSYLVLTDSGGIQEEAPALGKPVLVMRDVTERTEGIVAGTAKLVGTNVKAIIDETIRLLDDEVAYERMSKAVNPYGDGHATERILEILSSQWKG